MTLDEFEKKWCTGTENVDNRLVWFDGSIRHFNVKMYERTAPVGDFIQAYVEHLSIPWWRRKKMEWKFVEKIMREVVLNQFNIRYYWGRP